MGRIRKKLRIKNILIAILLLYILYVNIEIAFTKIEDKTTVQISQIDQPINTDVNNEKNKIEPDISHVNTTKRIPFNIGVLAVGGTDGSGTRRVVQILTALGVV